MIAGEALLIDSTGSTTVIAEDTYPLAVLHRVMVGTAAYGATVTVSYADDTEIAVLDNRTFDTAGDGVSVGPDLGRVFDLRVGRRGLKVNLENGTGSVTVLYSVATP